MANEDLSEKEVSDKDSTSNAFPTLSENVQNSSDIDIDSKIGMKIGAAPDKTTTPPTAFEVTWQRFVDAGFTSLSENQASLKEQLRRAEIKLNLYVPRSFSHVTPTHPIEDNIPILCANQTMWKVMPTASDKNVDVRISVLYFNQNLWVKFYRSDIQKREYFFYHAAVELQTADKVPVKVVSASYFDVMLPLANLMDMRSLTRLEYEDFEEKRYILAFKLSPIRFNLELNAENVSHVDEDAQNNPFCGPINLSPKAGNNKGGDSSDFTASGQEQEEMDTDNLQDCFSDPMPTLAEDFSLSNASIGEASTHSAALDGAPLLADDEDVEITAIDDGYAQLQLPLSETVLAEHKENYGHAVEPITDYDDFADSLNNPKRRAFVGYSQSVENSRANSVNEEQNDENIE